MAYSVGEPGSKEWWLARLIQRLLDRQRRYDYLEAYHQGNHPLPDGDERYVQALKSMQRKARTNYVELINSAPVERMQTRGFRINGEMDEEAQQIWAANNMDVQAPLLFISASALGNSYLMVSPPVDNGEPFDSEFPIWTIEDPRTCITETDPANRNRTRAALRMWQDDIMGQIVAILTTPNTICTYVGPATTDLEEMDTPALTKRLLSGSEGGGLVLISEEPNPWRVVPIVRGDWKPGFKDLAFSEAETVLDVQDRINSTILDRMVISRSQAYKQRWAKGIKIPQDKTGRRKPPFDPGSDMLWITENGDAEFGEFQEADIRQILEAIRDDVSDMAAITKTPAYYLMGKMANVSGSTLTQADAGLVSKTRQRMIPMGWTLERAMRISFLMMGNEKATASAFETRWKDPATMDKAVATDAFQKEVASGVPLDVAAERLGMDQEHIKKVAEAAEEAKLLEAENRQFEQELATKQAAQKQAGPPAR